MSGTGQWPSDGYAVQAAARDELAVVEEKLLHISNLQGSELMLANRT